MSVCPHFWYIPGFLAATGSISSTWDLERVFSEAGLHITRCAGHSALETATCREFIGVIEQLRGFIVHWCMIGFILERNMRSKAEFEEAGPSVQKRLSEMTIVVARTMGGIIANSQFVLKSYQIIS